MPALMLAVKAAVIGCFRSMEISVGFREVDLRIRNHRLRRVGDGPQNRPLEHLPVGRGAYKDCQERGCQAEEVWPPYSTMDHEPFHPRGPHCQAKSNVRALMLLAQHL